MKYVDFRNYVAREVIRDRAIDIITPTDTARTEFDRTYNLSLVDFAKDLNTIDPDYYYGELTSTNYVVNTEVDLGKIIGFAGAVDEYGYEYAIANRGDKKTPLAVITRIDPTNKKTYAKLASNNRYFGTNASTVTWIYGRWPSEITSGSPTSTELDFPDDAVQEMACLFAHKYYFGRNFYDEANAMFSTYLSRMNQWGKRSTPNVLTPSLGRRRARAGTVFLPFR